VYGSSRKFDRSTLDNRIRVERRAEPRGTAARRRSSRCSETHHHTVDVTGHKRSKRDEITLDYVATMQRNARIGDLSAATIVGPDGPAADKHNATATYFLLRASRHAPAFQYMYVPHDPACFAGIMAMRIVVFSISP
jgi:hypothetical protein